MKPDADNRIDGTTYPDDERAPEGSQRLRKRRSVRALVARVLCGVGVVLLRPRPDDVLVVVGEERTTPEQRERVNAAARRLGLRAAVFLPSAVRVHVEPSKLAREDRGYRETKTYSTDKKARNVDRGVYVGTPDDVPDTACE
jgi:hypothetical protein